MISDFGVLNMFVIEDCYFWEEKKLEICQSRNFFPKKEQIFNEMRLIVHFKLLPFLTVRAIVEPHPSSAVVNTPEYITLVIS